MMSARWFSVDHTNGLYFCGDLVDDPMGADPIKGDPEGQRRMRSFRVLDDVSGDV